MKNLKSGFLVKGAKYLVNYAKYIGDWRIFQRLQVLRGDSRFPLNASDRMAMVWEKTSQTGFDAHYVYHNAWALRVVRRIDPAVHVDISSTLYFCTSLSAFMPVRFYDYRPAPLTLTDLETGRCDLRKLHFGDNSISSLSCMHTIEHVGLGRYGDELDPLGDIAAFNELKRVVSPGGNLLVVVPVGRERLCFNAHRIYGRESLMNLFAGFELVDSALITDAGEFLENPPAETFDRQHYGCGCFWFRKGFT